jgi:hypothetical protein
MLGERSGIGLWFDFGLSFFGGLEDFAIFVKIVSL